LTFLVDTNVASEFRKVTTGRADPQVAAWARATPSSTLFISAITAMELEIGVLQLERRDVARGAVLRRWLEQYVLPTFAGRILPFDLTTARRCAQLHVPDRRPGHDAIIAATALVHGLTVVTRNTRDFEPTGVALLNPWLAEP
jgi:predicted nucleic acid-binding protein